MTDAILAAAAAQMTRDALWRTRPPLDAGCEHDLMCLPVIEFRQTVICRKCGGLDADASRAVLAGPARFISGEDDSVVRLLDSGLRVTYDIDGCP